MQFSELADVPRPGVGGVTGDHRGEPERTALAKISKKCCANAASSGCSCLGISIRNSLMR
jgi:hypothetical protein